MKLKEIETPVSSLKGVGPVTLKQLSQAGIYSIGGLLSFYPRDWEDRTKKVSLCEFNLHSKVHTVAQVMSHEWFGFGRMRTLKITIADETASAQLVCFNRPFLEKSLPIDSIIIVTGSFSIRYGKLQSSSFEAECISKDGDLSDYQNTTMPDAAVLPIYPLSSGLTQNIMRKIIKNAVSEYAKGITDELPAEIITRRNLLHKQQAVIAMHRPQTLQNALDARRTLIYEELFHFQTAIAMRAIEHKGKLPDISIAESGIDNDFANLKNSTAEQLEGKKELFAKTLSPLQKDFLSRLPFNLTEDQMQVIIEINNDIDKSADSRAKAEKGIFSGKHLYSSARLLQGDVGSGKTLVAFFACLRIASWGGQCAILAPTEILARQHAENAVKELAPLGIRIAFLTGNTKTKGRNLLLKELKDGNIDIVIGTHALFSKDVFYKDLQFVVIDEQHRFGVIQRNTILEKGRNIIQRSNSNADEKITAVPGLLMMSATPIPRTLALTVFGDLDISAIRTMPQGRKPIKTYLAETGDEKRVYEFVRRELKAGHQAYFVYPRIESEENQVFDYDTTDDDMEISGQTENQPLKSAENMFKKLSTEIFPEFKSALIHSKVEEEQQNHILNSFKAHEIDFLIATSVVEVGVDVPNANCMVIEHADRFGLAALHQIRGRVGRGDAQSYCFLIFGKNISETGIERMKALRATTDGFEIAEKDLNLRGPGEVTGIQQSGYLTLGIADPVRDRELLEQARIDAFEYFMEKQH